MKRVILAAAMVLGMLGVSRADVTTSTPVVKTAQSEAQCKYKLADARAGLKGLATVGFIPRQQSEDGNRVLGFQVYHNPASKDSESVDALALVLVDKQENKEMTFIVIYIGEKKSVVFKREVGKDGKNVSPCFERTLEDNPKENAK